MGICCPPVGFEKPVSLFGLKKVLGTLNDLASAICTVNAATRTSATSVKRGMVMVAELQFDN